jgi:HEPN domain-containing protein
MAKINFLKKRADEFLDLAKKIFREKYYNLAAFNLEQATQLSLKYYFGLKVKNFKKKRNISEII